MREAQLYPSGLHEKFNALFDFIDSADVAPAQQGRDVLDELSRQLDNHVEHFTAVVSRHLRAINEAIRAAGIPPLGVRM
jgi:hypothetical protein